MSQSTTGEKNSRIDLMTEKYESKQFNQFSEIEKVNEYLGIQYPFLKAQPDDYLYEASYVLARYAYFLQTEWNGHIAICNFCSHSAKQYPDLRMKFYKLLKLAQYEADLLYMIGDRIKLLHSTITNILYGRRAK